MGLCAIYAGLLYNEMFSIGLALFASGYDNVSPEGSPVEYYRPNYDVTNNGGAGPYPFGIDPAWRFAQNELLYVNSLKMKLSVLFGVLQMLVGVLLRWGNAIFQRNKV